MTKAGQIILAICVAASIPSLNGCVFNSNDSSDSRKPEVSEITEAENNVPKSVEEIAENFKEETELPIKLRDLTRSAILADGSQYLLMTDRERSKVELRFFPEGSIVRSLTVKTSAEGKVTTIVRAWNGKTEQLEAASVQSPWSSSSRELALIAGFRQEPPRNPPVEIRAAPTNTVNESPSSNTATTEIETNTK